jgi:hypothetical protein
MEAVTNPAELPTRAQRAGNIRRPTKITSLLDSEQPR